MSRWICVDDICIPSDENDWEELVAFADAIAQQEPIDIVRCGECKSWYNGWCYKHSRAFEPNGFCSYGEREDE
jgi:hypothetical protein